MGRKLIQAIGTNLDDDNEIGPLLAGRDDNPFAMFLCDTEADLPGTAWGRFAVVKEPDEGPNGPRHYYYVGPDDCWKRAELEPIDD